MSSFNYIERTVHNIRSLTPNHPDFQYKRQEATYTQKQFHYNFKLHQAKENLRKKSTRLSSRQENIVTTFDDLDRALNLKSNQAYTKKWKRLGRRFKINRLMDYYNRSIEDILKIYDKLRNDEVEYDEKEGKIINISNYNIFNA